MTAKLRTVGIWLATLLLAMLMGVLMTRGAGADGPIVWKAQCPAHHEIRTEPATGDPGGGVHVLCVRMAEEVKR